MMVDKRGFAPVQRGRLAYEVTGKGHPLVLLHAGVADMRMWDDQVTALSHYYNTIRYDLRGYGRSESEATEFSQPLPSRPVTPSWVTVS